MGLDKLALLLPPQDSNPQVTFWRYIMAMGMIGSILMFVGFMTGVVAPARSAMANQLADELAKLSQTVENSNRERIEQQIFEQRIAQCMAEGPIKTVYANRVAELVAKWRQDTGQPNGTPPTLVDCDDL